MEETNGNGIPKEEPFGNLVIHLKDVKSFEGNIDLNSVEAIVDNAFKGFHTISIEDQEKRYCKEERQELIAEINKLLKERENKTLLSATEKSSENNQLKPTKKTFKWIIVTCVLLFFVIFFLILLPSANKKKNVDKILDKIEFFIDNDKLDSVNVYSNRLLNRQLTDKQQKRYDVLIRERKRAKQDSIENVIEQNRRKREESQRNADPFKEKGWNYVRNRLKAPSTASLAGYVSPNEEPTRRLTDDLGMSGVKLAVFMVDAQNGFGAMIRTVYYVFFENGTPFAIMDESEVASANMTQLRQYLSYARS